MDEGYWESLLRDIEAEHDPPRPPITLNEPTGALAAVLPTTRWASTAGMNGDSEEDWQRAEALLANAEPTTVHIAGYNRGGLLADFGSLQGFIPASHLLTPIPGQSAEQRAAALAAHIGATMTVRVTEIDRDRCRLILSERLARQNDSADSVLANIRPGQICQGQVTSLCPFGAFVDLGGFEGLVHISELSWGRVNSPAEVVQPGDTVDLLVLDVHSDAQKIALSLKRLRPDPWTGVAERYRVGQVVDAIITNVVSFGAFARLEEGLEGLIHVSELAEGTFMHPRNVIHEGDRVRARVMQVDGHKRRIALTLRGNDGAGRMQAVLAANAAPAS